MQNNGFFMILRSEMGSYVIISASFYLCSPIFYMLCTMHGRSQSLLMTARSVLQKLCLSPTRLCTYSNISSSSKKITTQRRMAFFFSPWYRRFEQERALWLGKLSDWLSSNCAEFWLVRSWAEDTCSLTALKTARDRPKNSQSRDNLFHLRISPLGMFFSGRSFQNREIIVSRREV